MDIFDDANQINWRNFNATTLKLVVEFDHRFSNVLIMGNIFPVGHCFVSVTSDCVPRTLVTVSGKLLFRRCDQRLCTKNAGHCFLQVTVSSL